MALKTSTNGVTHLSFIKWVCGGTIQPELEAEDRRVSIQLAEAVPTPARPPPAGSSLRGILAYPVWPANGRTCAAAKAERDQHELPSRMENKHMYYVI